MQTDWHDVIEGYGEWHWYDTANQVFTYRFLDDDDDDTGSEQVAFQNDKAISLRGFLLLRGSGCGSGYRLRHIPRWSRFQHTMCGRSGC